MRLLACVLFKRRMRFFFRLLGKLFSRRCVCVLLRRGFESLFWTFAVESSLLLSFLCLAGRSRYLLTTAFEFWDERTAIENSVSAIGFCSSLVHYQIVDRSETINLLEVDIIVNLVNNLVESRYAAQLANSISVLFDNQFLRSHVIYCKLSLIRIIFQV